MVNIYNGMITVAKNVYRQRRVIVIAWLLSFFFYSFMTILRITNTKDGLWSGEYYNTGDSGVAEGRWLWPLIERLRFSNSLEPVATGMCLLFIVTGLILVIELFDIHHTVVGFIFMATVIVSPVVCSYLSYRFNSSVFGLSFLMAVMTVYVLVSFNYSLYSVIASVLIMVMDLAVYQAQMAVIMFLMLMLIIRDICAGEKTKAIVRKCGKDITVVIVSFIIYKIIWSICCTVKGIKITSYRGADNVTVADMFVNLPCRVIDSYKAFIKYYFDHDSPVRYNMLQESYLIPMITIVVFFIIIHLAVPVFRRSQSAGIVFLLVWALIPLTLTVYFLVADKALVEIQLTMTQTILFPVILLLADSRYIKNRWMDLEGKTTGILALLVFILGYGAGFMSSVDIYSAYEGRRTCDALMMDVRNELLDQNLYGSEYSYIFIGSPCGNRGFVVHRKWLDANRIMKFGYFFPGGENMRRSYNGLFEYEGTFIRFADAGKYDELVDLGIADEMPSFPEEGSIREIDGYVVVKISDLY